jgi:hypothetical protein
MHLFFVDAQFTAPVISFFPEFVLEKCITRPALAP